MDRRERIRRVAQTALLSATALVLSYLEAMIPLPVTLPGIKLGLANVAVVVALYVAGVRVAGAVAVVKVLASGLLFGSPMMLAYSLGGTVLSFAGMALLALVPGIGLVPVSMVAAILHNAGQLAVAALMLRTPSVFVNLPVLAVAACVTGSVTGAVAEAALRSLGGMGREGDARPRIEGSLELVPGERVAFVGANGSGKTTFALQLARQLGGKAGMAFQDPDDQIVAPVVLDDVAFGLENRGTERGRMLAEVMEALREVALEDLADREVEALSGGQRQRVAIAGLLAVVPGVVIFDESTSMLDPMARERFSLLLNDLAERGLSVVQITQLMDEAFEAQRIALFSDGKMTGVYTPDELLGTPDLLESCGLGLPRVARVACELRQLGVDVPLTNDPARLEEALACCAARR